jgi:hypothetical protein
MQALAASCEELRARTGNPSEGSGIQGNLELPIDDSPYYVFVALCIVVIVVSLIKIAASNENIECFPEYFPVGYRAPDPSFF